MIQECSRQIRPTALIASSLLESQNRASYAGAMPHSWGDWCFAGSPYLGCLYPLYLSVQLTSVLEAGPLEEVEKILEWDHGAERT